MKEGFDLPMMDKLVRMRMRDKKEYDEYMKHYEFVMKDIMNSLTKWLAGLSKKSRQVNDMDESFYKY